MMKARRRRHLEPSSARAAAAQLAATSRRAVRFTHDAVLRHPRARAGQGRATGPTSARPAPPNGTPPSAPAPRAAYTPARRPLQQMLCCDREVQLNSCGGARIAASSYIVGTIAGDTRFS